MRPIGGMVSAGTRDGRLAAVIVSFVFLAICVGCLVLGSRRAMIGRRNVPLTFAWLCAAMAMTLMIFSLFPDSTVRGSMMGFSVTGAAAFVLVVPLLSVRVQTKLARLDKVDLELKQRDDRIADLTAQLATLRQHHEPRPLPSGHTRYVRGQHRIGLVTGDLRSVDFVDIWVNSENVDLQMSRYHEKSVSGLIRYEGADRDATGRVTGDLVADALAAEVCGRTPVTAGTAIATTAGNLTRTNNVRHIIHSAAVQGEPGTGYRQVRGIDRCVAEALRLAESLADEQETLSIIFPLLGTGEGGADPDSTAGPLIRAILHHLDTASPGRVTPVHVLAYTDRELSACHKAFAEHGLVETDRWRR
jgi:O-acetyl-ADP-ribose deacetylase (regulator of RNase III)